MSLAQAMARRAGANDLSIMLNDAITDAIEPARAVFRDLLPDDHVVTWSCTADTAEMLPGTHWNARAAEYVYEDAMSRLKPDFVHVTSLFEGISDEVTTSIGLLPGRYRSGVTLYDLIPLVQPGKYLGDPRVAGWYHRKIEHLRRADLHLAISEFTRAEGIELLGLDAERVINISGSCSDNFHPVELPPSQRMALLGKYGISRPYVMYTGGFDARKNLVSLIRAYAALPAALRRTHQLAIVGSGPPPEQEELLETRRKSGLGEEECLFLGYVPDADLAALYSHCRLYVFPSLHEGFGLPALEAMACGAVVIGSSLTSLPEVIGLDAATFDPRSEAQITASMAMALTDDGFRRAFLEHAQKQLKRFSWGECARRAWEGFEQAHERAAAQARTVVALSAGSRDARVIEAIAGLERGEDAPAADDRRWRRLAECLAWNRGLAGNVAPRLMVDVSELAIRDARSGIQRVVRNVLRELLRSVDGREVCPVRMGEDGVYRHAQRVRSRLLGDEAGAAEAVEDVVEWRRNDVFLGLDMSVDVVAKYGRMLASMRDHGVKMHFVVYDLIPMLRPEFVNQAILPVFQRWYRTVAGIADGIVCISRAVADELREWLASEDVVRHRPLSVGHFHLGADLDGGTPVEPARPVADGTRRVLAVGTIEPRKGHAQMIDAFDLLWGDGHDVSLTIVGQQGWHVEELARRIATHREIGKRLHWANGASDSELEALYQESDVLLFASEAEGFGLPLIEAAKRGLPILARDIPVFREIAGDHASYFSGWTGRELADAIAGWFARRDGGEVVVSAGMPWLTWAQSARRLLQVIDRGDWDFAIGQCGTRRLFKASDPRLLTQVGRRIRGTLTADGQQAGFLVYGPYIKMDQGAYTARICGRGDADLRDCWIDISYDRGSRQAFKTSFGDAPRSPESGVLLSVDFVLDRPVVDLEARLWVGQGQAVALESIEFTRADIETAGDLGPVEQRRRTVELASRDN
ncbi:MAG: glycosyltransferase family 1 protein [Pseudoxanthomonas sp.]